MSSLVFCASLHIHLSGPASNTVGLLRLQHVQLLPALGPPAVQDTGASVPDGAGEPQ